MPIKEKVEKKKHTGWEDELKLIRYHQFTFDIQQIVEIGEIYEGVTIKKNSHNNLLDDFEKKFFLEKRIKLNASFG